MKKIGTVNTMRKTTKAIIYLLAIVFVEVIVLLCVLSVLVHAESVSNVFINTYNRVSEEKSNYTIVLEKYESPIRFYKEVDFHTRELRNLGYTTEPCEVPLESWFKSWTNYHVLSRTSKQWKLQELAHTNEYGLRQVDEYYCIAMGTHYSKTIGDKFIITLDNGSKFPVIICDIKSDRHTNSTNQYSSNNCIIEFYVDDNLYQPARRSGSISSIPGFDGYITHIDRIIEG